MNYCHDRLLQEVSIGGHCNGRVEMIKAMKEEVSRNRHQRPHKR